MSERPRELAPVRPLRDLAAMGAGDTGHGRDMHNDPKRRPPFSIPLTPSMAAMSGLPVSPAEAPSARDVRALEELHLSLVRRGAFRDSPPWRRAIREADRTRERADVLNAAAWALSAATTITRRAAAVVSRPARGAIGEAVARSRAHGLVGSAVDALDAARRIILRAGVAPSFTREQSFKVLSWDLSDLAAEVCDPAMKESLARASRIAGPARPGDPLRHLEALSVVAGALAGLLQRAKITAEVGAPHATERAVADATRVARVVCAHVERAEVRP